MQSTHPRITFDGRAAGARVATARDPDVEEIVWSEVQWIDGSTPNVFPGLYTTSNSKCYHVRPRWCVPVAALVGGIAPDT